ncbi:hypothetical protein PROFUN_04849 [Planoprotostelium fungivorum]|uniref:GATA-type domain-containing protein n=1 Tax=Planoprotostelium fungivorum TaxID=1890364 RepID=A0A2P6NF04_9EUKA|nr:hypothetical protein PROFUN_04849 [Planoprotostelium fungivorum]
MEIDQSNSVAHQVIGTSVYNFYKHSKLSKYSWPKDKEVYMEQQQGTSEDMQRDFEGTPSNPEETQLQSVSEQIRRDTSSSDDSLEDEDYQLMRDVGTTRRKRSRSTPNAPMDLYPLNVMASPAEAPAALSTEVPGTRKVRLCEFCSASDTPMWRRGPSGKGTLCNACGVKWSLNIRKRNSKKDTTSTSNSASIGTHTNLRRVSPGKNTAEQKSTGKASRRGAANRQSRVDGKDEDFTEESEEEMNVDSKEYYCGYCNTSWPAGHFKNIQQFGAHCSNCSRKHPKGENHSSEETGQKRKYEEEAPMDLHPSSDLGGLITAVESQLLEEHQMPERKEEKEEERKVETMMEGVEVVRKDIEESRKGGQEVDQMIQDSILDVRRRVDAAKREAIRETALCESAHRDHYQNSSSDMDNTLIANNGDEPNHMALSFKLQKIIEDKFNLLEDRLSESLSSLRSQVNQGVGYDSLLSRVDELQSVIEAQLPREQKTHVVSVAQQEGRHMSIIT